ncbi:MAG TPA: DoxX family protein [Candidatus Doudnabacteria bacterium]|nr:DoxX family protein [Candidatus Doudnabacteria bacterium]
MERYKHLLIFLLRISLGWILLYAGISKVMNPEWSAVGFLSNAKTFPGLYEWFASPAILPLTNFLNEWGQVLLGIAILLGVVMTLSSLLAAFMMMMYYFPILVFPYAGANSFIIDQHIIFAIGFLLLATLRAGNYWGLGRWWSNLSIWQKYPRLKPWLI